jgi:hypothetical protein
MPAVSKAQQKFMGMVHAAQKGEEPASPEVAKVAKDMSKKSAKDFASTKHNGLPNKVEESTYDSETDDLVSAIVVNPARVESKLPKPTNEILWKATGKVCEGRGMAERVKMYEKKGGGWRLGENRDEQVYNSIKEFYYNEVKKQNVKEVSDFVDEGGEGDHEVSMARNALQSLARNAQEIMGKIGINEKDIPGWIQDHISQANSFLNQVAQNYHEVETDVNTKDNFVTNNPNNQSNGK